MPSVSSDPRYRGSLNNNQWRIQSFSFGILRTLDTGATPTTIKLTAKSVLERSPS